MSSKLLTPIPPAGYRLGKRTPSGSYPLIKSDEDDRSLTDIRATYDRAYQRHMSNLDASINAVHDPMCNAADLRRYADACDESRAALVAAMQAMNHAKAQS